MTIYEKLLELHANPNKRSNMSEWGKDFVDDMIKALPDDEDLSDEETLEYLSESQIEKVYELWEEAK